MCWLTITRQIKGFFWMSNQKWKLLKVKNGSEKKALWAKIIKKIHQLHRQFKVFCMQVIECNLDQHMKIRKKFTESQLYFQQVLGPKTVSKRKQSRGAYLMYARSSINIVWNRINYRPSYVIKPGEVKIYMICSALTPPPPLVALLPFIMSRRNFSFSSWFLSSSRLPTPWWLRDSKLRFLWLPYEDWDMLS